MLGRSVYNNTVEILAGIIWCVRKKHVEIYIGIITKFRDVASRYISFEMYPTINVIIKPNKHTAALNKEFYTCT